MFNVYLDDMRAGPINTDGGVLIGDAAYGFSWPDWHNWIICRSVDQVKILLHNGLVDNLSLDHDLGQDLPTGYDLVKWMVENDCWPKGDITIHSANPVGAKNMKEMVDRYFYEIEPDRG